MTTTILYYLRPRDNPNGIFGAVLPAYAKGPRYSYIPLFLSLADAEAWCADSRVDVATVELAPWTGGKVEAVVT